MYEQRWLHLLLLLTWLWLPSFAAAQTQELFEKGMADNQSGRTAARAFDERTKKIDRLPSEAWPSEEGFLTSVKIEQVGNKEFRLCPLRQGFGLEAKRADVKRDDDACWRVTGKKKPNVVFKTQGRRVPCKLGGAGIVGLFDVHILEKEVIHRGHCSISG